MNFAVGEDEDDVERLRGLGGAGMRTRGEQRGKEQQKEKSGRHDDLRNGAQRLARHRFTSIAMDAAEKRAAPTQKPPAEAGGVTRSKFIRAVEQMPGW